MFRWLARLIASIRRLLGLSSASPPSSRSGSTGNTGSHVTGPPSILAEPDILTNTIRVLGTRGSGKTTYLAALLRNPTNDQESSPIKRIVPMGSGAERLIEQAYNILQEGKYFDPTPLAPQAATADDIGFRIEIYLPRRRWSEPQDGTVTLSLFTKDYSGEFLSDLRLHSSDLVDDYLADCAASQGLMLLVDGTNLEEDGQLEMNLPIFLRRLDQNAGGRGWQGRIAFVVAKCEQTRLYLKRQELGDEELVRRLFPKAVATLGASCHQDAELGYFALSSFGVLGGLDPEPNVKMVSNAQGEYRATIRNQRVWKPFGLAAPLYWLCRGERHPNL